MERRRVLTVAKIIGRIVLLNCYQMNRLTLGFTPHYYLDDIAIEIFILDHQSHRKSDAIFYSLSFSYMLIGALLPPEPGNGFPQNCTLD